MAKWNLPPETPPSYLDLAAEVTDPSPKMSPADFVLFCINTLLDMGLDIHRAIAVTANLMNETNNGQSYRGNNLGGVKEFKGGPGVKWFRAPGNRAPGATIAGHEGATVTDLRGGDPPWCYYKVYESPKQFIERWPGAYVPKDGKPGGRYTKTGKAFWSDDPAIFETWFLELCLAGYKGRRRQTVEGAQPSIDDHKQRVELARVYFTQSRLGVTVDGLWGRKSREACLGFQAARGLAETGLPDKQTITALVTVPLKSHGT